MTEECKQIILRDGTVMPYEISSHGIVYRMSGKDRTGKYWPRSVRKPTMLSVGYLDVLMRLDGKKYHSLVHTLVAFAFLPPPPGKYGRAEIALNHKNSIKYDNRAENLEWTTYQQNSDHAVANGLMLVGEEHPNSVLTSVEVVEIRRRWANGATFRGMARDFGCSKFAISCACKRITWKHI